VIRGHEAALGVRFDSSITDKAAPQLNSESSHWWRQIVRRKKDLVGDRQCLDIREWHRNKLLEPAPDKDKGFTWELGNGEQRVLSISVEVRPELPLILRYEVRTPGDKSERIEAIQLRVGISFSPCHYRGRPRPWFLCPGLECTRRVAILYLEGVSFVCHRCAGLTYQCKQVDRRNRALLHAIKIRTRLEGSTSVTDPFPEKPKGMRWKTYDRLKAKAHELELKWDPEGLRRALQRDAPGLDPSIYELFIDPKVRDEVMEMLESSIRKSKSNAVSESDRS
jgi:hypothetical protein